METKFWEYNICMVWKAAQPYQFSKKFILNQGDDILYTTD